MKIQFYSIILFSIQLVIINSSFGQSTSATNSVITANTPSAGTDYLGWAASVGMNLTIKNYDVNQSIDFYTDYTNQTGKRMTILGNNNAWSLVGIGTATPSFNLDVQDATNGGRINVGGASASAFMIGGSNVLWNNGIATNIYVGQGAGNSNSTAGNLFLGYNTGIVTTGNYNSFEGYLAGTTNTTGYENTFLGNVAGTSNVDGFYNTFIGTQTGFTNSGGRSNTFIGNSAGYSNTGTATSPWTGSWNTFTGSSAGYYNTTGNGNSFYGKHAGWSNTTWGVNCYYGSHCGEFTNDEKNCFYGANTGERFASGKFNTLMGYAAGNNGTITVFNSGTGNVYLGAFAEYRGATNTTGDYNTLLGYNAQHESGKNNSVSIGKDSYAPDDDQVIIGNNIYVGIGLSGDPSITSNNGPQNMLEINAGKYPTGPAFDFGVPSAGDVAYSGLRLRDMTDICSTEPNLGPGVLSVNSDGDVIYVPKEGIGNYCNPTPGLNPLTDDFEIPMDKYNYYFTGQGKDVTDVIIGKPCGTIPGNPFPKLWVVQSTPNTHYTPLGISAAGEFYDEAGGLYAIGAFGKVSRGPVIGIGVWGDAQTALTNNVGVLGTTAGAVGTYLLGGATDIGVYGAANVGVPGIINYGVIGDLGLPCPACLTPGGCGACLPTVSPDYAGYFNGDVYSTTFYALSDSLLKENIQNITNPMNILNQLNPKSYTFKQDQNRSMYLNAGTHYGLLSQDVEAVLPQLVKNSVHPARYDSLGNQVLPEIDFKALNYTEFIPFLIAAVKEQQLAIAAMQTQLNNCCNAGNRQMNPGEQMGNSISIDVELKNAKTIILNVAVPNPFAEHTTITYFIPEDVIKAQIIFYDTKGTVLKTVDVLENGAGQINVYAQDLSSGVYSYSLIADGKLIETKKMVKQD